MRQLPGDRHPVSPFARLVRAASGALFGRACRTPVAEALETRLALDADLALSITGVHAPGSWFNPGESIGATVEIANLSTRHVAGWVVVRLSAVQTSGGSERVVLESRTVKVGIRPLRDVSFDLGGVLDSTIDPGSYRLEAAILPYADDLYPLGDTNPSNNVASSFESLSLAYRFGSFGQRAGVTLTLPVGGASVPVSFSLTGGGSGRVIPAGVPAPGARIIDAASISVTGTGTASAMVIDAPARVAITSDISVSGPLASFESRADFEGNDLSFASDVGVIGVRDMTESGIDVLGTGPGLKFTGGVLHNTKMDFAGRVSDLAVVAWTDDFARGEASSARSRLRLPGVGNISCQIDFEPPIRIPTTTIPGGAPAIASVDIGGVVRGAWRVGGAIGGAAFGGAGAAFTASISGVLDSLHVAGDFSGTLAAGAIGKATIAGNLARAVILAGTDLGEDCRLGGSNDDQDTFPPDASLGWIGAVSIGGAMTDSTIGAAYYPGAQGLFIQGQTSDTRAVSVMGALTGSSRFYARAFPPAAIVGGVQVSTAGHPRFVASL